MTQVTLNITEDKLETFLEYIKTLDYVKVESEEEKVLGELQNSLNQVKLMRDGKLTKQSAVEFLDEL